MLLLYCHYHWCCFAAVDAYCHECCSCGLCLLLTAVAFLSKVKVRKLGMKGMIAAAFCGLAVLALLIAGWNHIAV